MALPDGTPFPGCSIGTDWVERGDGSWFSNQWHNRAGSTTISAGQDFWAHFYTNTTYLTAGDTAACSWVFEVLSGSGTLHLRDGMDPQWGGPASTATNDLGTLSVTGPGTYVVPASAAISVAELVAWNSEPGLYFEVLTGSIEVQQLKLRVWPPDGAHGSWSDAQPGYDSGYGAPSISRVYIPVTVEGLVGTSLLDAYHKAQQAARAQHDPAEGTLQTPVTIQLGPGGGGASMGQVTARHRDVGIEDPSFGDARMECSLFYITALPAADARPPGTDGVDYVRHPNEVENDPVAYKQAVDGDLTPDITWVEKFTLSNPGGYAGTAPVHVAIDHDPAPPTYTAGQLPIDPPPGWVDWNLYGDDRHKQGYEVKLAELDLPQQGAGTYRLWTYPSFHDADTSDGELDSGGDFYTSTMQVWFAPGTYAGDTVDASSHLNGTFSALRYTVTQAPYRKWDPSGSVPVVEAPLPLRQRQRDDGLGLSTARWSGGRSRQASNRWRSYR